jgi:hypothetical protein
MRAQCEVAAFLQNEPKPTGAHGGNRTIFCKTNLSQANRRGNARSQHFLPKRTEANWRAQGQADIIFFRTN